jgi:CcmD family protein
MPSENLPYLFAAYAVTWAIFFIYVFFVSRRQREMEKEIRELREALEVKENPGEPFSRVGDD